ncbi:folylpolyglutamate synthase [Dimargaris cristalligena]|nr:folylpolyglutamate synthase [Dimargaris cristalligena]
MASVPAGINLSCVNLTQVLEGLGHPERSLRVIQVGGTNGKGSVCACLTSILRAAGFTVGTFNSPHLLDPRDSIAINYTPISSEDWSRLQTRITEAELSLSSSSAPVRLTHFERLTCTAILWFAERQIDFAILEVGVGGRRDATSVCRDSVLVSVLTSIGLDHVGLIGNSLGEIAHEKSGIFVPGRVVIVADQSYPAVLEVLEREIRTIQPGLALLVRPAHRVSELTGDTTDPANIIEDHPPSPPTGNCRYVLRWADQVQLVGPSPSTGPPSSRQRHHHHHHSPPSASPPHSGSRSPPLAMSGAASPVSVASSLSLGSVPPLPLTLNLATTSASSTTPRPDLYFDSPLLGSFQLANFAAAIHAVDALRRVYHMAIPDEAIQTGMAQCHWPGRLETRPFPGGFAPEVEMLIDGAHNMDSAMALSLFVDEEWRPLCASILRRSGSTAASSPASPALQPHPPSISNIVADIIATATTTTTTTSTPPLDINTTSPSPSTADLTVSAFPVTWIYASSEGKAALDIIKQLVRPGDRLLIVPFTQPQGMPWVRCMEPGALAEEVRQTLPLANTSALESVLPCLSLPDALQLIRNTRWYESSGIVLCGSLYLVSDFYRLCVRPADSESLFTTL